MSRGFFDGWSDMEIAMHGTQWGASELAAIKAAPVKPMTFNTVSPAFKTNPFVGLEEVPLFADSSESGFMFTPHEWKKLRCETNWRWRYLKDGIAHRDEAMRRMIVCRLDGNRAKETEHWRALMRFFENMFKLTELTPDGDSTSDGS